MNQNRSYSDDRCHFVTEAFVVESSVVEPELFVLPVGVFGVGFHAVIMR